MAPGKKSRKRPRKGARTKLREFFTVHVGEIVEGDDLRKAAGGITEWARRVRELRQHEGMFIETHNDNSALKQGQYRLVSLKPRPVFSRRMSKRTRAYVLDRNGFTCQMCGAAAGEPHPANASQRTRLHIGHIVDLSHGGTDEPGNLRALCSVCNEGAQNLTLPRPTASHLLAQLRRASGVEQLAVLRWLVTKYPREAQDAVTEKER